MVVVVSYIKLGADMFMLMLLLTTVGIITIVRDQRPAADHLQRPLQCDSEGQRVIHQPFVTLSHLQSFFEAMTKSGFDPLLARARQSTRIIQSSPVLPFITLATLSSLRYRVRSQIRLVTDTRLRYQTYS